MKPITTIAAAACVTCALASGITSAQTYPAKPVRAMVGFATGGQIDAITRIVAAKMADGLKQLTSIEQAAQKAVANLRYRRRGLFISLGAILLVVITLALKVRDLNARGNSASRRDPV